MIRQTPWGAPQTVQELRPGAVTVSTAGHGGVGVSTQLYKYLTPAARRSAQYSDGYYWYEEDCDYAIPVYELHLTFPWLTPEKTKEYAIKTLQNWHVDYLLDTHPELLDKESVEIWVKRQKEYEAHGWGYDDYKRAEKWLSEN